MARTIKVAMYIRINNPTMIRNIGKYNLGHKPDILTATRKEIRKEDETGSLHPSTPARKCHIVVPHVQGHM